MILEYIIVAAVIWTGLTLLTVPLIHILMSLTNVPDDSHLRLLSGPIKIIFLGIYLVVIPYFTHQISKRKVFETMTIRDSLSGAIADARFKLSFLPIIGTYFAPKIDRDREDLENKQ